MSTLIPGGIMLSILLTVFKDDLIEDNITTSSSEISWSILVEDKVKLEKLYDKLYALESYINYCGYSLLMQDDHEYFGGQLTKEGV